MGSPGPLGDAARGRGSVTRRAGTRRWGLAVRWCGARAPGTGTRGQCAGRGHGGRGSSRPGTRAPARAGAGAWRQHVRGVLPALDRCDGHPGELPAAREARVGAVAGPRSRAAPLRFGAPFARADMARQLLGVVLHLPPVLRGLNTQGIGFQSLIKK